MFVVLRKRIDHKLSYCWFCLYIVVEDLKNWNTFFHSISEMKIVPKLIILLVVLVSNCFHLIGSLKDICTRPVLIYRFVVMRNPMKLILSFRLMSLYHWKNLPGSSIVSKVTLTISSHTHWLLHLLPSVVRFKWIPQGMVTNEWITSKNCVHSVTFTAGMLLFIKVFIRSCFPI